MRIKPGFIMRDYDDMFVVVPVQSNDFSGMIKLNKSGAFIWKQLERGADTESILSEIMNKYEADEPTARLYIDEFTETLKNAGILDG